MPAGKKVALVLSQGNPDAEAFSKNFEMAPLFFKKLGVEITDTLLAAGVPDAAADETLMRKAYGIGAGLAKYILI